MKICSDCKRPLLLEMFSRNAQSRDGRKNQCRPCAKIAYQRWIAINKEVRNESASKWRKANSGKQRLYDKKWKANNPDSLKKQRAKWQSENKPHLAERTARYRAKVRNASPAWSNIFFIKEAYSLASIRSLATGIEYEVDHIVPIVSGLVCGLHVEHNLRVIESKINQAKGNRHWPNMPR